MKRRNFLHTAWGLGATAGLGAVSAAGWRQHQPAALHWRSRSLLGFGTALSLQVAHDSGLLAEQALDEAIATLRHVEGLMSLFKPDSALSQLNRDGVLHHPHADLVQILTTAQDVSQRSGGAFDVTVQPLWAVFDEAARRQTLPTTAALASARAAVGWQKLTVAPEQIRLEHPGMGVTLNGIAQGFAADLVKARLQALGVRHALVNTGEWAHLGQSQRGQPWVLGVANPLNESSLLARLALAGRSLATSADNACHFSDDKLHHHIFNPHTGDSPTELAGVSVVASSCVMADALTKVMFVAGADQALRLAPQWGVDVMVVKKDGSWEATPGLAVLTT